MRESKVMPAEEGLKRMDEMMTRAEMIAKAKDIGEAAYAWGAAQGDLPEGEMPDLVWVHMRACLRQAGFDLHNMDFDPSEIAEDAYYALLATKDGRHA